MDTINAEEIEHNVYALLKLLVLIAYFQYQDED